MNETESFHTVKAESRAEVSVKSSKFIAHAAPVRDKEAAENYVRSISDLFKDATHNCFAYRLGVGPPSTFRFSDAGEPSGTAGKPILQAIDSRDLTNVAVVVTRYFGGTKLGTGGLIRAYSAAAHAALDQALIVEKVPHVRLHVRFDYDLTNAVEQVRAKFNARIAESEFEASVSYFLQITAADEDRFVDELMNATGGKVEVTK